jgi:hypothetical protein
MISTCCGCQRYTTRRLPYALERSRHHHTIPRRSGQRRVVPRSCSDSARRARRQNTQSCSGNLASNSFVLVPKSLGSKKTARAPVGSVKSVLMSIENTLFRKKLARVIRDDCTNQASKSKLTRDFNDRPNQNCLSNSLPPPPHKRQSGLRWMTISIVRPAAPRLSISCSTPCEKNADRTAPVSARVRLCSTAKSSPTSTSSRLIPAVA